MIKLVIHKVIQLLIIFSLSSCTVFHLTAKTPDEFMGLMQPRLQFEYGYQLRSVPKFEGQGKATLRFDKQGYMTECEIESEDFPQVFKSRLCLHVFDKIRYVNEDHDGLTAPLEFKLKPDAE